MGCSSPKENLEDQIMILKLKRIAIQMEREKHLKILSEIEGRNIDDDNFPEYLASINIKQIKNINMKYDEEKGDVPNEIKNQNSTKGHGLDEDQNRNNNILPDNNIKENNNVNRNESHELTIHTKNIKKKIIRKKKRIKSSLIVNNINDNENI